MTPATVAVLFLVWASAAPAASFLISQVKRCQDRRARAAQDSDTDRARTAEQKIITEAEDCYTQEGVYFTPRGVLLDGQLLHDWIVVRCQDNPHGVVHAWKDCPPCLQEKVTATTVSGEQEKTSPHGSEKPQDPVSGKVSGLVAGKSSAENGGNYSRENDGTRSRENGGGETLDSFRRNCWNAVTGNWDPQASRGGPDRVEWLRQRNYPWLDWAEADAGKRRPQGGDNSGGNG